MKRLFSPAGIRCARIAAILVVLVILAYAEEDWRGANDWAICQKELQAKGETLDLHQLVPPGKPEDDLSKVPLFAELYEENHDRQAGKHFNRTPRIREIDIYLHPSPPYSESAGKLTDLVSWQKYYRSVPGTSHVADSSGTPAQDVLKALSQYDSIFNEIDTAISNPNAHWPIDYERPFWGFLGGISSLSSISGVIELRAVAHLDNGEPALAEKEFLFTIRLGQSYINGCFLYKYLSLVGMRKRSDDILAEGLSRHSWSVGQLREMELDLASTDMLALGASALRLDEAGLIQTMKIEQGMEADVVGISGWYSPYYYCLSLYHIPLSHLRPSGWWNQDRVNLCRQVEAHLEAINVNQGTLDPEMFPRDPMYNRTDRDESNTISTWRAIYTPVSSLACYGYDDSGLEISKAETSRRFARLACRLEEFRIAQGEYPEKLAELPDLPAHLNQEVLSEEPLRYRRKGEGYLLYSVGWDQKDDGAIRGKDDREGDWVWEIP